MVTALSRISAQMYIEPFPNATLIKKDRNDLPYFRFNVRKEYIRPSGLLRMNLKNRPMWASFIAAISNLVFGVVSGAWVLDHLCVTHCELFATLYNRITISWQKSNLCNPFKTPKN
jgi:hypothetical protein